MYRISAGIETMGAGYKHILIQPHPTMKLTYAKATFESPYGTIGSGWERKEGKVIVKVKIPANTTATIILPAGSADKVKETGKALSENTFIKNVKATDNKVTMMAGSGDYTFEISE
jgi:alpha-L-rhamnosidase